jgi:hypothetical protein
MSIIQKTFFVLSVVALSSFDSRHPFLGVDGAITFEPKVKCERGKATKKVCVGETTISSPSPAIICTDPEDPDVCDTIYVGGYRWQYVFVKGLKNGVDDPNMIADAHFGPEVMVIVEDDKATCEVWVGNEQCQSCSAEGCEISAGGQSSVKYDCTNISKGRKSLNKCAPLDPFLYPLRKGKKEKR